MKIKISIICLMVSLFFIGSINVFAAADLAKEGEDNYAELKNQYNSANKISVNGSGVVTIYGKSDCNGTRCSISYAGGVGNDSKKALAKLVVCTGGEKNILYQVGGSLNHDFKETNNAQYTGTVYWSEEYQITCSANTDGQTNIQLSNTASGGTSNGGTSNGGTSNGGTSNGGTSNGGSNNGYQSSDTVDNPEQGVTTYFVVLGLISFVSYGVMLLVKKYNLFKSI